MHHMAGKRRSGFRNALGMFGYMASKLRTVNGVDERRCSTCGNRKPLTAFSPGGESHQGSEGGRRLIEARREREGDSFVSPITARRDYTIVVAA